MATKHPVTTRGPWIEARKTLLAQEKALTRQRDALARARRDLPWVRVDEPYVFEGPRGKRTMAQLFDGRAQLVVYHFMFGPDWEAGCPNCSFWADHFEPMIPHLRQRDVTLVAVSRAPRERLAAYQERMGWGFDWYSSYENTFNRDYGVTFTEEEVERGDPLYSFGTEPAPDTEAPGLSVFYRDEDDTVFRTYSTYTRGLDILNATYHYLDVVPKGRDEDDLPWPMAWVRRHDEYER